MSKGLKTSRLGRIAGLARVGLRTGTGLLSGGDGEAAAKVAAEVLGSMRGLAAKLGQMAGYVDGLVPEAQRDAYEAALAKLQTATVESSFDQIRAVIESELGAPIGDLFAKFSITPLASASIGQVHRAVLADGRVVAVKVQHPGIEAAIESDLKNLSLLTPMIAMMGPAAIDIEGAFGELRDRFREELDYVLEAKRQERFAELHAHDPSIVVPRVIEERSSKRVLTTDFVEGLTLEQAAELPDSDRRRYAEVLWRFAYRGILVGRIFNADPHPGNYFFQPDGRIAFLDFGCVQELSPEHAELSLALHAAGRAGDEQAFREHARALLQTDGGRFESLLLDYSRRAFSPVFESPFRISRSYVTDIVHMIPALKGQILARESSFRLPPRGVLFLTRLQFGFYSVLARLDVEVDYAAVEEQFLAEV